MMQSSTRILAAMVVCAALAACRSEAGVPAAPTATDATPAAAPATAAASASAPADSTALTCDYPVKLGSTVEAVKAQFGKDAKVDTMTGAEGIEYQALVLWSSDPTRRLELPFDEEEDKPTVEAVDIGSSTSRWRVRGLAMTDSLAKVREVNGKPFGLYGFDWEYGGNITGWNGGRLEPEGRCGVSIRFRPGEKIGDDYAMGDSEFTSDDPKVAKARAVIDSLGVNLRDPE